MLFSEFKDKIDFIYSRLHKYDLETVRIGISTDVVSSVGTYISEIKSLHKGFDFDNNKVIIYPEVSLRETDKDELSKLQESARQLGWDVYALRNLKHENKKLLKRIKDLEEIVALKT